MENAKEMLLLTVGDAEQEEIWATEITRTPRLIRTFGRWENWTADPEVTDIVGRFSGLNEYMQERS